LINLLIRFYDVRADIILVDGQDIHQLSCQDYRRQFGMVLQDAWLYEGTIKENLRFGNLDASDEEIIEAAKLAKFLKKQNEKLLLVGVDVYRPAAIKQLQVLGQQIGVDVYSEEDNKDVVGIATRAIEKAKEINATYMIVDTAGRLHVDETLMNELKELKKAIKPQEILLVVDAMIGQDAVNLAESFNNALSVDGVILTKLDGDTRGGAALSIKAVVDSSRHMARRRIGALIVLENNTGLDEYVESGITVNAEVTNELIINIFIPNTPLHDGAMIIDENKIRAASCVLPLSDNRSIASSYGTRHRAALGLSEVTDAIVIAVSEETGKISVCQNGVLTSDFSTEDLAKYLAKNWKQQDKIIK